MVVMVLLLLAVPHQAPPFGTLKLPFVSGRVTEEVLQQLLGAPRFVCEKLLARASAPWLLPLPSGLVLPWGDPGRLGVRFPPCWTGTEPMELPAPSTAGSHSPPSSLIPRPGLSSTLYPRPPQHPRTTPRRCMHASYMAAPSCQPHAGADYNPGFPCSCCEPTQSNGTSSPALQPSKACLVWQIWFAQLEKPR